MNSDHEHNDERSFLTSAQAASRAKVSRPTISRALSSGEIMAFRDNRGHWKIKPADIDQWMKSKSVHMNSVHERTDEHIEKLKSELGLAQQRIARLEGEASVAASRLTDAQADRDRWQAMAEKLTHRSGWWSRILRK